MSEIQSYTFFIFHNFRVSLTQPIFNLLHTHPQHLITILLKLFACLNDAGIILTRFLFLIVRLHVNQNSIKGLIPPSLKSTVVPFSETTARQKWKMQNSGHVPLKGCEWSVHLGEPGPWKRQKMWLSFHRLSWEILQQETASPPADGCCGHTEHFTLYWAPHWTDI